MTGSTAQSGDDLASVGCDALRTMRLIREFERRLAAFSEEKLIRGSTHPSVGMEAVAVGVALALRESDVIVSNHRGHGHCLARGADPGRLLAEIFGRVDGYCSGKGGSMHIAVRDLGILGTNGIVGAGIGLATGSALSSTLRRADEVTVAYFGDGAVNQGIFAESMNLAAVWALPVLFVCENNHYAQSTPMEQMVRQVELSRRGECYGVPAYDVDGMDVMAVYRVASDAVARARAGDGPMLIVADTYRYLGHMVGDTEIYRDGSEVAVWQKRDPVERLSLQLLEAGQLDQVALMEFATEAVRTVDGAERFARKSAEPPRYVAFADVSKQPSTGAADRARREKTEAANGGAQGTMTMWHALNAALREALSEDETVIVMGEDLTKWGTGGGIYGVTKNLLSEFGPDRVRDTPISEEAIVSAAVGAAMRGVRPVVEIMYSDFTMLAMDAIVNQAAKAHYMFGGQFDVPLVIRSNGGSGIGKAAQHSQSLESLFAHVPGLDVVVPGTPGDAYGLLLSAIKSPNPTLFLEHKALYGDRGPVGGSPVPLGVADVVRPGRDVTVVATQLLRKRAIQAAEALAADGIEVEVIDPRTLFPLDVDTIFSSVTKTGRLLVTHEAPELYGFGGELVSQVTSQLWDTLRAAPQRVCGARTPIPYAESLEKVVVPDTERLVTELRKLVREDRPRGLRV